MNLTIQHIEVHVSSLESAKMFYVEKLGLEVLEEIPAINLLALKAGHVRVSVFAGFEPAPDRDRSKSSSYFVFRTDNIEDTFVLLQQKGLVFKDGIKEAPGFVKFISTTDPDGNTIEIGQYLRDPLERKI